MFKHGQVITRDNGKKFYLVISWPEAIGLTDTSMGVLRVRECLPWVLVGNNYQAKPKCSR